MTAQTLFEGIVEAARRPPKEPEYAYSNFGFMLLALLLERATEKSYAELVEARVCRPLDMLSTRIELTDETRNRLVDGHSMGRQVAHWLEYRTPGAGGIASTGNDLLRLVEAYLNGSATPIHEALALSVRPRRSLGARGSSIALGWFVARGRAWHSGGTGGFRSYVGFNEECGVGVVVLANSKDESTDLIGDRLLDALEAVTCASPTE